MLPDPPRARKEAELITLASLPVVLPSCVPDVAALLAVSPVPVLFVVITGLYKPIIIVATPGPIAEDKAVLLE